MTNDNKIDDVTSMEKACLLLQSLHHQILYNDSPPSNEASPSAAVLDTYTSPELVVNASSKKLGNDILAEFIYDTRTMLSETNLQEGAKDDNDNFPEASHALLASEEQPNKDFTDSVILHNQDTNDDSNDKEEVNLDDSIDYGDIDNPFIATCPGNEDGTSTSFLQLCFVPTDNRIDVKENKNGMSANAANDNININNVALTTTRTLKMYGSEYARFQSQTPFSPLRRNDYHHHPKSSTSKFHNHNISSSKASKPRSSPTSGRPPVRGSSKSYTASRSSGSSAVVCLLEDASPEVQAAPIVDICITHGSDPPPPGPGYYRIGKTCTASSNSSNATTIFLNVKKEPHGNWESAVQRPWVSSIAVIFPDRNEFVPPGYCVVKRFKMIGAEKHTGPADLNECSTSNKNESSQRVYLCYKKSREGNPIVSILPLLPSERECIPPGFTVIEKSPRNFTANINEGVVGPPIFLAIRQRLSNLETLRPLPLLKFQVNGMKRDGKQNKQTVQQQCKLLGYYATGGIVVPTPKIGRLHSMDRLGHDYLSPSSMATRISLAYDSPAKADFTPVYQNWLKKSNNNFLSGSSSSIASESVQTTPSSAILNIDDNYKKKSVLLSAASSDSDSAVASEFYQSEINQSISQLTQDGLESFSDDAADTYVNSITPSKAFSPNSFTTATSSEDGGNHESENGNISSANGSTQSYSDLIRECRESMSFIPQIKCHLPSLDEIGGIPNDRFFVLTPILTACYTFHGGSQLLALDGLNSLLCETNFFLPDVDQSDNNEGGSDDQVRICNQTYSMLSPEQTLLDLTIQVICDVAMSSSRETYFRSCVDFCANALRFAVQHGGGANCLHSRSLGYIFRLYMFVCSFEVSLPDNKSKQFMTSADCRTPLAPADDASYLFDSSILSRSFNDFDKKQRPIMDPAQAAEAAMKEMIYFIVKDLDISNKKICGESNKSNLETEEEEAQDVFILSLVTDIVDSAANKVNMSNLMQLIANQVYRGGGSELFWHDMTTSAGITLFGSIKDCSIKEYVCCFALLASLVKAASGNVRYSSRNAVPRDILSKILSMELLLHFMESFLKHVSENGLGDTLSRDQILMYSIRRLVVPCILSNALLGDKDQAVFRRCFSVVKILLESPTYRKHHKVELAVLMEQYVLRILSFGPMVDGLSRDNHPSVFQQQLTVLTTLKIWLCHTPLVFEIFINYDGGSRISTRSWKSAATNFDVFGQLSSLLCAFIEECVKKSINYAKVNDDRDPSGAVLRSISEADRVADASRLLLEQAVTAFGDLARTLVKATTELCWHEHENNEISITATENMVLRSEPVESSDANSEDCINQPEIVAYSSSNILVAEKISLAEDSSSLVERRADNSIDIAFDILVVQGIKKAVEYLTACNILTPSPRDIASFLRLHQKRIDPSALGDYLGEENLCGGNQWNLIRYHYVRVISFVGLKVDEALRQFVTNCGFHLPGEAQRIDRIISTFSQCFWEDNAGDHAHCPFYHQDTVCLLAFAIIMLNTDLHKASSELSSKSYGRKVKRMSRDEFMNNLKRAVPSEELPKEYIFSIYDSIEAVPMILSVSQSVSGLISAASRAIGESPSAEKTKMIPEKESCKMTAKAIKYSQEMLRTMSLEGSSFLAFGKDFDLSPNLIHRMLNTLWFNFHGTVNALLTVRKPTRTILAQCLDMVHSVISCSLQLDLNEVWQMAFVRQLSQIVFFLDRLDIMSDRIHIDLDTFMQKHLYRNYTWYQELSNYIGSSTKNGREEKNEVLRHFDRLVSDWRAQLHFKVDPDASHQLDRVAHRIRNGLSLVTMDPTTRTFIREGDLTRHLSSGRKKVYRFFLFSDRLMYGHKSAHKSASAEQYVIHSELPLAVMKIDSAALICKGGETSFHIFHPIKSFLVSADSIEEKMKWITDIQLAIGKAVEAYSRALSLKN